MCFVPAQPPKKGEVVAEPVELVQSDPEYKTLASFHADLGRFLDGEHEFSECFVMEWPVAEASTLPEPTSDGPVVEVYCLLVLRSKIYIVYL